MKCSVLRKVGASFFPTPEQYVWCVIQRKVLGWHVLKVLSHLFLPLFFPLRSCLLECFDSIGEYISGGFPIGKQILMWSKSSTSGNQSTYNLTASASVGLWVLAMQKKKKKKKKKKKTACLDTCMGAFKWVYVTYPWHRWWKSDLDRAVPLFLSFDLALKCPLFCFWFSLDTLTRAIFTRQGWKRQWLLCT